MKAKLAKKGSGPIIIAINAVCLVLLIAIFFVYNNRYKENIQAQNLANISNLNGAAASLTEKYFESGQQSLKNMSQYIQTHKFSREEILDFLNDANADVTTTLELIGDDYTGWAAQKGSDGEYVALSYGNKDYAALYSVLSNADFRHVGEVSFAPEFTDDLSGVKCFALCTIVPAYYDDGTCAYYTLLKLSRSSSFVDMLQMNGSFDGLTTTLIDKKGNYIISNSDFKSDNLFQYMYTANGLTLDEKNALQSQVTSSESGTFFYKNSRKADCAYVYKAFNNGEWYMVSCAPLSSFVTLGNSITFTMIMVTVVLVMLAADVLWLNGLNRRLKQSMEKERRANSAKTDFLSRMSHDIRTPLNAVIGFSELAADEPGVPAAVTDNLTKINSSGKYLLGLINDILDMSKIESSKTELHPAPVEQRRFLDDIAVTFAAQAAQKGIVFTTDFPEGGARWLEFDALRMRQIYSNLLNNAVKFSAAGTEIKWSVTDTELSDNEMRVVSIVEDHGCGMSREFMQNLFQPFVQEQNSHSDIEGGTGLGLAIVKSFAELMGGTVEVESELGKGSKFIVDITLPRCAENVQKAENEAKAAADFSVLNGKRVLLCEDHPLNREIAVRLLTKQKMSVETAENGKLGLEMFKAAAPGYYDAVLMDIRMPVMDGLDATRAIRALDKADAKTVPIIAMTANAFSDDIQNCLEAGLNAHVAKPIEPAKLYQALAEMLK